MVLSRANTKSAESAQIYLFAFCLQAYSRFVSWRIRKLLLLLLLSLPLLAGPKSQTYSGLILSTEEDFCGKSVDYVLQASLATENRGNLVLVLAPK